MLFPPIKRVIYNKNPLIEVICQIRIPPVLSIDTEIPAKFQEAIRKDYPLFKENAEVLVKFPAVPNSMDPALAEKIELSPTSINRKNYEFLSSDENWKINLTRDFLALSTKNYHRWEEFKSQLEKAFILFSELYTPVYITRTGLRYRNIINRTELDIKDVLWSELLKPHVLGMLNDEVLAPKIKGNTSINEISLDDGSSTVRITSGLIEEAQTKEKAFMIDSDFFTEEKISTGDALKKLDFFNENASRLIQWCITEKLHNVMEPEIL